MLEELLINLTKAVAYSFPDDGTRPGVLVSMLNDGKVYASVVRYGSGFKNGKMVVCKCYGNDYVSALRTLSEELVKIAKPEPNPVDALKDLGTSGLIMSMQS